MNKPLIFALRGAAGFGLMPWLMSICCMELLEVYSSGSDSIQARPGLFLSLLFGSFFLAGTLGATVLFFGTAHWLRAALGFGVFFIPVLGTLDVAVTMATEVDPNGLAFDEAVAIVVIWSLGPAVYAGFGAFFKQFVLALPAVLAFALPGLILGPLTLLSHYHGALPGFLGLPISGALFGFFVGRAEERLCATPPPPD